jgi:hypothetical protein
MANRKVRVNSIYTYNPVLLDIVDARTPLTEGSLVRVINKPGCPKANTMGMCYVSNLSGEFLGMVCTNSLDPVSR